MKDFAQVINQRTIITHDPKNIVSSPFKQQKLQDNSVQISPIWKNYLTKYASPFLLSIITGPFTTASILMQVTSKSLFDNISIKCKGQPEEMVKLIKLGVMGDNKIYNPPMIKGYHDCFQKIGKEGLRGMYKGNLTGIMMLATNGQVKQLTYGYLEKFQNREIVKTALTIGACTLADIITLPLMICQSRLVLQNSLPNFRTYSHFFNILAKTTPKRYLVGGWLLIGKNTLSTLSWMSLWKQSPVYSFIISSALSHILSYPFITIIRNLQCDQPGIPMMHSRGGEGMLNCIKRIHNENGISGFYRGFLAYGIVHMFLGAIMIDMNIRSGYFNMVQ